MDESYPAERLMAEPAPTGRKQGANKARICFRPRSNNCLSKGSRTPAHQEPLSTDSDSPTSSFCSLYWGEQGASVRLSPKGCGERLCPRTILSHRALGKSGTNELLC
jgi:hypothetical protein